MPARELGIAALEIAAIVGLVGLVRRVVAGRRSRPRSRPAAGEQLAERHRTLRAIAAASYGQQATRDHDRKDRG